VTKTFNLEIVTPDKLFYSGAVEIVVVRTVSGEEGFLADHVWVCKLLASGELRIREPGSGEHRLAMVSGGFVDVHGDVLVFTDTAEWKED
jgi:F-type H+-transporting ATPase subunit epsilon